MISKGSLDEEGMLSGNVGLTLGPFPSPSLFGVGLGPGMAKVGNMGP